MKFLLQNKSVVVTLLLVLALALYLWLTPWIEFEIGSQHGPEATRNQFLAMEKFLDRYGVTLVTTEDVTGLGDAINKADVLLMTAQNGIFDQGQLDSLFAWVRQGGTLIYQPTTLYAEDDRLYDAVLQTFLKHLVVNPAILNVKVPPRGVHHRRVDCDFEVTTPVTLNSQRTYQMGMSRQYLLKTKGLEDAEAKPVYIADPFGKGRVILITGLRQWRNNLIQCHDNALVLYEMMALGGNQEISLVWLDGAEVDSIIDLLWDWFPQTVFTLVALLLFWLWNRFLRDQLVETDPPKKVNSLEDYLSKKAAFRWRNRKSLMLLQALRVEIAAYRWRGWKQSDYERIAALAGIGVDDIRFAFTAENFATRSDLVKVVATLNQVRKVI